MPSKRYQGSKAGKYRGHSWPLTERGKNAPGYHRLAKRRRLDHADWLVASGKGF
jgi:hypothetical protein